MNRVGLANLPLAAGVSRELLRGWEFRNVADDFQPSKFGYRHPRPAAGCRRRRRLVVFLGGQRNIRVSAALVAYPGQQRNQAHDQHGNKGRPLSDANNICRLVARSKLLSSCWYKPSVEHAVDENMRSSRCCLPFG